MKKIVTAILGLALSLASYAQEKPAVRKNEVGLAVGITRLSLLDELNSPLIYRSTPKTINLFYARNGEKAIAKFGFLAGNGGFMAAAYPDREIRNTTYDFEGNPTRDSVTIAGSLNTITISFQYLRRLTQKGNWHLFLGADLQEQLYYPDNFVRTGFLNTLALSLATTARYTLSTKQTFSFSFELPVVAYLTRFPYHSTLSHPEQTEVKMFFNQGSNLTSVHEFQQVNLGAAYQLALSQRWNIHLNYEFSWLHYREPKPIRLFYNQMQAGVAYKF